ncbi:NAD-dependent protein deacetylase [Pseudoduganella namucuonensis]|uniref:NAD-dependent protein deacetylase n=1 Tax=Pseudoduganella namucuonensis TaxID=1035707 RepID=A0A1I7M2L0_9BURK|nr:NAD-dependent protein deacetylase [Pseudoduganella namucuonensis]SFV16181.1 NAD-dependent protein deacetylase, SIR2 family [Pseudoduganella namucuonensis]
MLIFGEHEAQAGAAELAGFLARHRNVLVLTGAGISTASGIPDYRDKDGVRRGRAPVQGPEFRKQDAVRRRYWARSMVGWPTLAQASPNAAHVALAELESRGGLGSIITQNVDGLHQRAGSRRLIELHGNIHGVVCLECRAQYARVDIQRQLLRENPALAQTNAQPLPDGDAQLEPEALDDFHVPHCARCGGVLQPDVVFFGDNVPPERTGEALRWMAEADALLVVGSSLMVFSGYRFCKLAAAAGKPIAAINAGKTRADDLMELKIAASAEIVLPMLAKPGLEGWGQTRRV